MADISGRQLSDYLASFRGRKWQPGILDCGVFMADWVKVLCGLDPISDVRGSYSTKEEFEAIVKGEGGFMRSSATRLKRAGFVRSRTPGAGDIAIVLAPSHGECGSVVRAPTGAICVDADRRAVITSDMGLVIAAKELLPSLRVWTRG